jgi:hypothetical protein
VRYCDVHVIPDATVVIDAGLGIEDDVRTDLGPRLHDGARAHHGARPERDFGMDPGKRVDRGDPLEVHPFGDRLRSLLSPMPMIACSTPLDAASEMGPQTGMPRTL